MEKYSYNLKISWV